MASVIKEITPSDIKEACDELERASGVSMEKEVINWAMGVAAHSTFALKTATDLVAENNFYQAILELKWLKPGFKIEPGVLADQIAKTKEMFDQLKCLCSSFCDHLANALGDNMSDTTEIKSVVQELSDKAAKYKKKIAEKTFSERLQDIHQMHFMLSVVSLCFSGWQIYQTWNAINDTTAELIKYKKKLDECRDEYIQPVLDYHGEILARGSIKNYNRFKEMESKLKTAFVLLREYHDGIEREKSKMATKCVNNAVSSVVMGYSALATFVMPGAGLLMKALGTVQSVAAVGHGVVAVKCAFKWKDLANFNAKIQRNITALEAAQKSLEQHEPVPDDDDYVNVVDYSKFKAYAWNNDDVMKWTKRLGSNYENVSKTFNKHNVEGPDLLDLDHKTLESLGINNLFLRKQLLRKINTLFQK